VTDDPTPARVKFVSTADWNAATDRAINDPAYTIADDPRCLYGWGPPTVNCVHTFGHTCERLFGHPGKCMSSAEDRLPCEAVRRPRNWDIKQRAEYNS